MVSGYSRPDTAVLEELEKEWIEASLRAPKGHSVTVTNVDHPDSNEDRVLCDTKKQIAAVFDGMGGAAGGERSAQIACGVFTQELELLDDKPATDIIQAKEWLANTLLTAGQAVHTNKYLHREARNGGTTGVAVQVIGKKALTITVGDSRGYRWSAKTGLDRLTYEWEPWGEEQEEIVRRLDEVSERKELNENLELMRHFVSRNVIQEELSTKLSRADVHEHDVEEGDIVFVCSDAIHDNLTLTEMAAIATRYGPEGPDALAKALVEYAQKRSEQPTHIRAKHDDMSVACLLVQGE